MSKDLKNSIHSLRNEISNFNTNDVLVNCETSNSKLFFCNSLSELKNEDLPNALLRETRKTIKDSGVNPLCFAKGLVRLKMKSQVVSAPVLLNPLSFHINKIKGTVSFNLNEEDQFVNPYLVIYLNLVDSTVDNVFEQIEQLGLETENNVSIIGNFHHHRYEIIKELDELAEQNTFSDGLRSILGFDKSQINADSISLPSDMLFPADIDHRSVFNQFGDNNLVIQGPPGTGKSQLLANILGKLLSTDKKTIVVSEKRVALEVLKNKLAEFDLDKFCFIATSDHLSHEFLQELKRTWDYLESLTPTSTSNLNVCEQLLDNLQMTLDFINQPNLIGGVSFYEFTELSAQYGLNESKHDYLSQLPEISAFVKHSGTINRIFDSQIDNAVGLFKTSTLKDDHFNEFDVKINEWMSRIGQLSNHFTFVTWNDFSELMKEASVCQIFENAIYKKHASLFVPNSREQKAFLKLRKKFKLIEAADFDSKASSSHWKITPSEQEIISLIQQLESHMNWFAKRKLVKRWEALSNVPMLNAKSILESELNRIQRGKERQGILIKFIELGIEDPAKEIDIIYHTIISISDDQWIALEKMSPVRRLQITNSHKELNELYGQINRTLQLENNDPLLAQLKLIQSNLPKIIVEKSSLEQLEPSILHILRKADTFSKYAQIILNSHLVIFKERFPIYAQFSFNTLKEKVNEIIKTQEKEAIIYSKFISSQIKNHFDGYHKLLNTPARKLSEEEKQLKKTLRKGKSILIREFSKTRSHPSLREIFNSEARLWVQLLKPIWLSNPSQLAKCFPMDQALFDVAIFDEASQIPLQNALGTIQRSKKIAVAGDEHQMGPSSYFKSGPSEVVDLLHQANYYWSSIPLKHHYRSVHPDLIGFSNRHFYQGELKSFPSYKSETPIKHHFISNGKFIDRKNVQEATALSQCVDKIIDKKGSIGIVAFSEEQLNAIWNELSEQVKEKLTVRIDENTAFFKALENVQGDECDHLFISFGYGFNDQNEFHIRFGPMNTQNGRNRLNVLLTRAIRSIDFYCSVKSSDFKLSDNESINLIKQWISFSEGYKPDATPSLPFDLDFVLEDNKITFRHIQKNLPNSVEIVTLQHVLQNRGWNVEYS